MTDLYCRSFIKDPASTHNTSQLKTSMTFLLINQWKEKLQDQIKETSLSSAIPSEDTSLQAIITTDCSSETANTFVDHGQLVSVPLSLLSVCLVQLFAVPLRHAEHEHPSFKTRLHAPAASRTRPEGMLSRVCTPTIASFIHFVPLFSFPPVRHRCSAHATSVSALSPGSSSIFVSMQCNSVLMQPASSAWSLMKPD